MRRRSRTGSGTGVTTNKPCLLNEFGRGASTYRSHPERVLAYISCTTWSCRLICRKTRGENLIYSSKGDRAYNVTVCTTILIPVVQYTVSTPHLQ